MIYNKWTSNIIEPLLIVMTQLDPIKDVVLVRRMIILLGGPMIILTYPDLFSSCVSHEIFHSFVYINP